jgi:hypothetical protein
MPLPSGGVEDIFPRARAGFDFIVFVLSILHSFSLLVQLYRDKEAESAFF